MIAPFGKILRKLRIDHGEILKTMSDKLGMTSSYLSAIECGKRRIPDDLIEKLSSIYDLSAEAHFEVVEPEELEKNEHAVTDITSKTIKIRCDVYESACEGGGRDRMTIAHEFAHFITLCVLGFKLARSFDDADIPAYQDPEWQAKCLAGELMIDSDLVKGMSPSEVSEKCGVSYDAAAFQLSRI